MIFESSQTFKELQVGLRIVLVSVVCRWQTNSHFIALVH